jgi:hypothetical protein
MKMHELFPSKYLKGEEIKDKPILVTIVDGKLEKVGDDEYKPVLYFKTGKPIVLNKTNGDVIADAYGDDTDGWIGKKIILYFERNVSFAGKRTGGIRVRIPNGVGRSQVVEPEPEEPDEDEVPPPDDQDQVPF